MLVKGLLRYFKECFVVFSFLHLFEMLFTIQDNIPGTIAADLLQVYTFWKICNLFT